MNHDPNDLYSKAQKVSSSLADIDAVLLSIYNEIMGNKLTENEFLNFLAKDREGKIDALEAAESGVHEKYTGLFAAVLSEVREGLEAEPKNTLEALAQENVRLWQLLHSFSYVLGPENSGPLKWLIQQPGICNRLETSPKLFH